MNADAFRHLYNYHFGLNRYVWNEYITPLSDEQFTRSEGYSHGSVRNQIVHVASVDDGWFSELANIPFPESLDPATVDRSAIRAHWDAVEQRMRGYLAQLRDDMLSTKPIVQEEDKDLFVWQVLLHVSNHGTDHRAQTLRLLNDLGLETVSQDYMFYAYDHPVIASGV
jgi:uncharacterized damage-inducible protein DinB